MTVATKIISGFAVLIALMLAVVVYQVFLIRRMQSVSTDLSSINFSAALASLNLIRDLDQVEEHLKRGFVSRDPSDLAQLKEAHSAFTSNLQETKALGRSEQERLEIERLERFWSDFSDALADTTPDRPLPPALQEHLARLNAQTQSVHLATRQAIQERVEQSARTGERAEWISWTAAAVALVLGGLVSLLIAQSILDPLKHLTAGTRAIAEGKSFYRLDTSRSDEFAQLARDFNSLTLRLTELDQMKKDFVSHVSHELKSPLASMRETIHLLLEQIPGALTDKQRRLLELNLESGKRLSTMIGNLLDLSRMEAGVMEYELKGQDLVVLIRDLLAEFEVQAREKGMRIESNLPELPLVVKCDRDRILQVIGNLLVNALKFSRNGATIGIRASSVTEIPERVPESWKGELEGSKEGFVLVSVNDTGPGVPDPHKEKIFQKFHQIKPGKKIAGQGVGLGLAISKIIVEAHRGAIWVEDNPGGGSVFNILLWAMPTSD
jgi:two-component system sensor histidine kinase GlrK